MTLHSTNYRDTLVTVSDDGERHHSIVPGRPGTIAALQWELLAAAPYVLTSDDLLWRVETRRNGTADTAEARAAFFSVGRPCLRASPLVKSHGWGIHHDAAGRIALIGVETPDYARLLADPSVKKRPGLRSGRGGRRPVPSA